MTRRWERDNQISLKVVGFKDNILVRFVQLEDSGEKSETENENYHCGGIRILPNPM